MIKEEATVLLTKLICVDEGSDAGRYDQMFIRYSVDGGGTIDYPHPPWDMETGDATSIDVELKVKYESKISITLYEYDSSGGNDPYPTQYIDRSTPRNDKNEGVLNFVGSGSSYELHFRVLTDPIPTVRLLGIRCEQTTAGMNVNLVESIAGAAQSCMEAAATVLHMSPRPSRQLMAEAFEKASAALATKVNITEWKKNILEGRDDIYMRHVVQAKGYDGAFFPPNETGEAVYKMWEETEVCFESEYGKYFRFPLDSGPVTIEIREKDTGIRQIPNYDVIAGALILDPVQIAENSTAGIDGGSPEMTDPAEGETEVPSSIEGGAAIFNGDAVVEIANSYYGRHNGEGAAYLLCYSVGMEDWCLPATSVGQSSITDPQMWYSIVNQTSQMAWAVSNNSKDPGATIVQWDVNDNLNQQFRFIPNEDGTYKIKARGSGLYVKTENWDFAHFTQESSATKFTLKNISNDYLQLYAYSRPTAVGEDLGVHGSPIVSAPTTRTDSATRFKLVPKEQVLDTNKWYELINQHSQLSMNVSGAEGGDNVWIIQWPSENSENSQFKFIEVNEGRYKIQARHSKRYAAFNNDDRMIQHTNGAIFIIEGVGNEQYRIVRESGMRPVHPDRDSKHGGDSFFLGASGASGAPYNFKLFAR